MVIEIKKNTSTEEVRNILRKARNKEKKRNGIASFFWKVAKNRRRLEIPKKSS
jgi:hypothetical protein